MATGAQSDISQSNWGPSYWRFIHYFSTNAPDSHELLAETVNHIPCVTCKSEWVSPDSNTHLLLWSIHLHNKVNTKLHKYDKWTTNDFGIAHKTTCDKCFVPPNAAFPWTFIHTVAKVNDSSALTFLKKFNTLYPCDTCRGGFFTDDPLNNESVLDWTVRNHVLQEPTFVYLDTSKPCTNCPANIQIRTGPILEQTPAS